MGAAPRLYHQPAYQSTVRGDPDDLLLLAGDGLDKDDIVVYRAIADTAKTPRRPTQVPRHITSEEGLAAVVAAGNVPHSLTIKLPQAMRSGQAYALWVRNSRNEWSGAVLINDARPLWVTPSFVYATATLASLPRELKIVGRNLAASPGHRTRVELIGPETISETVIDSAAKPTLDRYVARISLPAQLLPGAYRVRLSRDGRSWIEVPDQRVQVRPDQADRPRFAISDPRFGGCLPDDGRDDSGCVLQAITAAKQAGGGVVYFGPGTWDLMDGRVRPGVFPTEGILVPSGVALEGAGRDLTNIVRHPQWSALKPAAAFTIVGNTFIHGFRFRDLQVYTPADDDFPPFLQLGEHFSRVAATAAEPEHALAAVDDVVIAGNVFDKTFIAVADAGLPIHRLTVTGNEFGAYFEALRLTGNRYNVAIPFRIDDSVFDDNVFKPGGRLDAEKQTGDIGSELGASLRVDFSGNIADGSATDYLYNAADPRGWEAAFFWNMNNNVEDLLVSDNRVDCAGDRIGDGAAISFDDNGNTIAFPRVSDVSAASPSSVTPSLPLLARQNVRDVSLDSYYAEHWIQVVSGPGVGQARRIAGYTVDSGTRIGHFKVFPDWDVPPVKGRSRVSIGREYWQVYTIANEIDHRKPLCLKSNRKRLAGGGIGLWAQTADSVIEGNRQFDTDGILTQQAYILPEHPCNDCPMGAFFQYFLEIRGNTIDGEYDWNTDCSASGIAAGIAAAPWHDPDPPTVGYGVSISHNIIRRADAAQGGGIAQMASWYPGPEPHRWVLSDNMLVYHNQISDLDGPPALALCGRSQPRTGIFFPKEDIAWHTVLYGNSCTRVSQSIRGEGAYTVRVCPSPVADSCECPPQESR